MDKFRQYAKTARGKYPALVKQRLREWEKRNRAYLNARKMLRMAAKKLATPAWANQFFIEEIYDLAQRRTKLQTGGIKQWHVDHIVPLTSSLVCGLHVEHNLRVIPARDNHSKKNYFWPEMP